MKIHKNTVTDQLWEMLMNLMRYDELSSFRLVGGTSLSLLLGHRMSVDIDLFTDANMVRLILMLLIIYFFVLSNMSN